MTAVLRLSERIQVNGACRAPLLDAEPNQIGRPGPFQHFKGQYGAGEQGAQTNPDQHDMNAQPGLQTGNGRRRAAIAVVDGGGHGVNGARAR